MSRDKREKEFLLDKVPPQDMEAEKSFLGSLLLDKDAIVKIADQVSSADFYSDNHGKIYEMMLELFEQRMPIDIITLSSKLKEKKQLDIIGGSSYLTNLANSVPSAAHVTHYGKIISQKATLRRLINASLEITEMGFGEAKDVEMLLDEAEQKLFGVSQKHFKENFIPIKNVLSETFDRIDKLHKEKGTLRGVPTGFKGLDNVLAGFQKSDLIILAARPSMGKTALALNIAANVAIKSDIPVGIFSLEMSKEQLVDRLLCSEAKIDAWKLKKGMLTDEDFPKIGYAMGVLSEAPIYIDDSVNSNVMDIRTKARRLQSENGLGMIVIDYLQLMEGRSNSQGNRVQEISEISRALKGLARELNVPVLALSQLSRAVEQRDNKIPQLSDLRESGSIEQDADVVMFIYREDYYNQDAEKNMHATVYVKKHRNGPTGKAELMFKSEQISFKDAAKREGEPEVI
ncbi:replicative DNA helicase [bacterium]|nr:replicative DNA helicase [bacterium]